MWYWIEMSWALSGMGFWFGCMLNNTIPAQWEPGGSLDYGWRTMILIWLPMALVGGPLLWAGMATYRFINRK